MSNPAWPTRRQYAEAILRPQAFLSDPELKATTAALNPLGLTLTWAGQYAAVFRLSKASKSWAVRCFTSQISDQRERYAALNQTVQRAGGLSCLVGFDYQPQGISVDGSWYPIIKMEWIDGQTLDSVIDQYVRGGDVDSLRHIRDKWLAVVRELRTHRAAHGDLQHDNILVHGGDIRLVDYDGFYVPALAGRQALELGIPHYQHPRRTLRDYNDNLDNFSALVIYLTLDALTLQPQLWARWHEDKRLLLAEADYSAPHASRLLQELRALPNPTGQLAQALVAACLAPVYAVPALEALLGSPSSTPAVVKAPLTPPQSPVVSKRPVTRSAQTQPLTEHAGSVFSLAFSPDGGLLASVGADKTVRICDVARARELRCLRGHTGPVYSVAFSPDGRLLASSGADMSVRLWSAATWKEGQRLTGTRVAFVPDGRCLALAYGKDVILWDRVGNREVRRYSKHSEPVHAIALSPPDGRYLATASASELYLWDVASGTVLRPVDCQHGCVAFSPPDGRYLATAGHGGAVHVWQVDDGGEARCLGGQTDRVYGIAFTCDGRLLAYGNQDGCVRLWDVQSGQERRCLTGRTGAVLSVAFSYAGRKLATGGEDGVVKLWRVE